MFVLPTNADETESIIIILFSWFAWPARFLGVSYFYINLKSLKNLTWFLKKIAKKVSTLFQIFTLSPCYLLR